MTCIDYGATLSHARIVPHELLEKLSAYPKAFWGERVRRSQRARDLRKLRQMSDSRLEDIGLRRADIGERFEDLGKIRPDLVGFIGG